MAERILVCDVDGVVIDLSYCWYEYLRSIIKDKFFSYEDFACEYAYYKNLSQYVTEKEAMWFWNQETLYDNREPLANAAESLWALKREHGFKIVFASHVEGQHAKGKFAFLKKHFPVDGFMATREKQFVRADVAIDDRYEHLLSHPMGVGKILKFTPHKQTVKDCGFKPDGVIYEWGDSAVSTIIDVYQKKKIIFR